MAYQITHFDGQTNPITSTYPYGDWKDNDGTGDGTIINRKSLADIYQTFQKLVAAAGVTLNNLPDNAVNGFQLFTALQTYIDAQAATIVGAAIAHPSWTTLTGFNTGWSAGTYTPQYTIDALGYVQMQGTINNTTGAINLPLSAALPVGYRPLQDIELVASYYDATLMYNVPVPIAITMTGVVGMYVHFMSTTGSYLDLSAIRFPIF